jgi:hypothetical protein
LSFVDPLDLDKERFAKARKSGSRIVSQGALGFVRGAVLVALFGAPLLSPLEGARVGGIVGGTAGLRRGTIG